MVCASEIDDRQRPGADRDGGAIARSLLLVEDNLGCAKKTAVILRRRGWQVHTVIDAGKAVMQLSRQRWNALLCDLHLPGESGLTVIRAARSRADGPRVLAMSGALDANFFLAVAMRAGAHAALVKPVTEVSLIAALG